MKFLFPGLFVLVLLGGCLSVERPPVRSWMVEEGDLVVETPPSLEGNTSAFSATRLGAIAVDAPFDRTSFVVRRADGSVAFDPLNEFAAAPSALLRGAVRAQLVADGRFGHVVSSSSLAGVDASVEVIVNDLSLDCRESDRRVARAAVKVTVVKAGRTREIVLEGRGGGTADAKDGNYGGAFTQAVNLALREALHALTAKERK